MPTKMTSGETLKKKLSAHRHILDNQLERECIALNFWKFDSIFNLPYQIYMKVTFENFYPHTATPSLTDWSVSASHWISEKSTRYSIFRINYAWRWVLRISIRTPPHPRSETGVRERDIEFLESRLDTQFPICMEVTFENFYPYTATPSLRDSSVSAVLKFLKSQPATQFSQSNNDRGEFWEFLSADRHTLSQGFQRQCVAHLGAFALWSVWSVLYVSKETYTYD